MIFLSSALQLYTQDMQSIGNFAASILASLPPRYSLAFEDTHASHSVSRLQSLLSMHPSMCLVQPEVHQVPPHTDHIPQASSHLAVPKALISFVDLLTKVGHQYLLQRCFLFENSRHKFYLPALDRYSPFA